MQRLTADKFNVALCCAIPVTFIACKSNNIWIRSLTAAGISGVFLSFQSSQPRTVGTMMASVLAFLVPLKATQLLLFPSPGPTPTQQLQRYSAQRISATIETIRGYAVGRDFLSFVDTVCEFAWLAAPLTPVEKPTMKNTLFKISESLISFGVKTVLAPIIYRKMLELSTKDKDKSTAVLSLLFAMSIVSGTAGLDLMKAVVLASTLGRWEVLDFNRYPFLSTSVGELWSRRYNLLISRFLHDTVFLPMRRLKFSPSTSAMAAFSASGILHVFVAYHTFQTGLLGAFVFFNLQGAWVSLEYLTGYRRKVPSPLRALVTAGFFAATFPLYGGLFISAMPEWLHNNPVPIAGWSRPVVEYLLPTVLSQ